LISHVVPGFFETQAHADRIVAVPVVIAVDDEETHRSHFVARDASARPSQRYVAGFENIRKLQRYVKSQALTHGVPVIPNFSFDQALASVIDLVMERATERAAELRAAGVPGRAQKGQKGRSA